MSFDLTQLPISKNLTHINKILAKNSYLVIKAAPGAGKSTAVPLFLLKNLDLGGKKIVMLEPRRLAARSIAEFLAAQMGEKVGSTIGYQVRNERKVSNQTRLEIVTEGILNSRIQADPELQDIGLIIFDEFHERSIHADLGLSLCKEITQAYNEQLKVLVMSATIDTQQISDFLDTAPVIEAQGRCYPVDIHYLDKPLDLNDFYSWQTALFNTVVDAYKNSQGDTLVFLPGQGEIKRLEQRLIEYFGDNQPQTLVLPLYGSLKSEQQQQALAIDPQGRRKIVLATNIAETSLTIENIATVIDSGLERTLEYDVASGMNRLITQRISKASSEQRAGRAGRVQAGQCYRLWTQTQQLNLADFAKEQITQVDLADLRLILAQWGVKELHELEWITPPPKAHYQVATVLLQTLGFLDPQQVLTANGVKAAGMNLTPRLANIIIKAQGLNPRLQSLAADVVAVLGDSHFYYQQDDADLSSRVLALQAFRANRKLALKSYPIKASVAEQALKTAHKIQQQLGLSQAIEHSLTELQQNLGALLSYAYPDRVAKLRNAGKNGVKNRSSLQDDARYLLANGRGAVLAANNRMQASEWLIAADLDGQRKDGKLFLAAEISQEKLSEFPGFSEQTHYGYDASSKKISAEQQTCLGKIVVKQTKLSEPDKTQIQACLAQIIVDTELSLLPWNKATQQWLNRIEWLQDMAPEFTQDWPDFSAQGLMADLQEWLMPYISNIDSIKALNKVDLFGLLKARLGYDLEQALEQQVPVSYQTPSGKTLKIDYKKGQLPKVSVVLQELFGELDSPKLAWGKASLSFELLSPAQRPIQTTADLNGFWQNSYFEVAKEMRGRYPKHRWPEQPLLEKAGRSLKPRKS